MRVVIIGGVAGGMSAATRLRRLDEHAEIIVFERGKHVSFANCGLPYHVGGVIEDRDALLLQTPESLAARLRELRDIKGRDELAPVVEGLAAAISVLIAHRLFDRLLASMKIARGNAVLPVWQASKPSLPKTTPRQARAPMPKPAAALPVPPPVDPKLKAECEAMQKGIDKLAAARDRAVKAAAAATRLGQRDLVFQAARIEGAALAKAGQGPAALEAFRKGLGPLEEMRSGLKGDALKALLERPETAAFARDAAAAFRAASAPDQERLAKLLQP